MVKKFHFPSYWDSQHQLRLEISMIALIDEIYITLSNLGPNAVQSFVIGLWSHNDNKKYPTINICQFPSTYVKSKLGRHYPQLSSSVAGDEFFRQQQITLTDDGYLYENFIIIRELDRIATSSLKHMTGNT